MSEPATDAAPAATPAEPKAASTADLDKYKVRNFPDRLEKKFKNPKLMGSHLDSCRHRK
jgi:hypothetical protein